jgi:hypothetical protein
MKTYVAVDLDKLAKANIRDWADVRTACVHTIDRLIDIGDRLIIAQGTFDVNEDFDAWLERTHPFRYVQATKYIRLATHKVLARVEVLKDPDISIDELQNLLPYTKEAPLQTQADPNRLAYVGTKPGDARDADDWHTPLEYLEAARAVLGVIDLDPFSDEQANTRVKATRIITVADDGFTVSWADPETRTVWMNPPYTKGASSRVVDKFIEEYDYGSFDEAIVLMNSSTDTNWCQRLMKLSTALCFTQGRISFLSNDGKKSTGNTKGQIFFYIGPNIDLFQDIFEPIGLVLPSKGGRL